MGKVFSKVQGVIAYSGGTMPLRAGASFDESHPLVKERPELFDNNDPGADHKAAREPYQILVGDVERGTQAPGEVRVTPGTGPQQGRGNRVPKTPPAPQDGGSAQ